ncbi:MAG: hypothetical protein RMJ31_05955 [Nitrososphaerota archaeon]|nr:hypothetical protein [Nitrososphaerota archaeon]
MEKKLKFKELLGLIITIITTFLILYEVLYVNLTTGSIGTKGVITMDAILLSTAFLLILIGPWLWLGEVPLAVKKLMEGKTGAKAR